MEPRPATMTDRITRSIRRFSKSTTFGLRYVRAATFQVPENITYKGKFYALNLPKTTDNYIAFIDIFLDDAYKINYIKQQGNNITQIIDIGAHSGLFSLYAKMMLPEARAIAFEPNKKLLPFIEHHAQLGKFEYSSVALGSKHGKVNLVENEASSVQNFTVYDDDGAIDVVTLADIQKEFKFKTIDILKMDCEGAEWDIFSDPSVLKQTNWLTMEYHLTGDKTLDDMIALLEKNHFKILNTTVDGPTWGMLLAKNQRF